MFYHIFIYYALMSQLMYVKICMVFTVGFAGLNIHQLMASYDYVKEKVKEFKSIVQEESDTFRVNSVSILFYFIIPSLYLFILLKANFFITGLIFLASKFFLSAILGIWTQKRILSGNNYSKTVHMISKCDNLLNIIISSVVIYLLLYTI